MLNEVLQYFYFEENGKKTFIKSYFIRVIRNRIIDPNTKNFLEDGFKYFDESTGNNVAIPCDDANWCEYMTFDYGFKESIFKFPFSMKLHNDYFKTLNSYSEFQDILKKVADFRVNTIKHGWAIKYGLAFQGNEYPELEELTEKELLLWKDPRVNARYSFNDLKPKDFE